jgi:hypothetical protein
MTRALLEQALNALDTCDAHLEVSGMNYGYYFNQEAVHNAVKAIAVALAQPEPMLAVPVEDADPIETNLEQHRREAWDETAKDDDFDNFGEYRGYVEVTACGYFHDGWKAAVAKYTAPPAPILAQPDEWCDDCHAYTHREGNPCYPATPPDYALSTTAMDYLQRTGLIGSPLRQVEIAPPAPTGDKSCTGN